GAPAALSRDHHSWPVIDEAIDATRLGGAVPASCRDRPDGLVRAVAPVPDADARALFHRRRSAVAMDGHTGTDAPTFFASLQRVGDATAPPLALLPWRCRVHLLLFVHRIEGLEPGLYLLVRRGQDPR